MKIAVLSGKGGVGKSSVAASLAVLMARDGEKVVAADCDVDAANLALVLGVRKLECEEGVWASEKARLDSGACSGCGKCERACAFGAVAMRGGKPEFRDSLCEGCGACALSCPAGAIRLERVENARIGTALTRYGFPVVSAQLKMGESSSGKVVFEVKKLAGSLGADVTVIDSAAGIGCPVLASVQGCDYAVAVTEPTPAALRDLERALGMLSRFGIPAGVVINKADMNPEAAQRIRGFCGRGGLPVLAEIPYDAAFVEALAALEPPVVRKPALEPLFRMVVEGIRAGTRR
jgi:MinD superfamily P-loop ATPase